MSGVSLYNTKLMGVDNSWSGGEQGAVLMHLKNSFLLVFEWTSPST